MNKTKAINQVYSVALNSDRVHISLDNVPVETIFFSRYEDKETDNEQARTIAIGVAVAKALELNDNKPITVAIK